MRIHLAVIMCLVLCALVAPCCANEIVSLKGHVVDAEGDPVQGIRVYAVMVSRWYGDEFAALKAGTTTAEDGSFAFDSLREPAQGFGYDLIAFEPDKHLGWASAYYTYDGFRPSPDNRILVRKPGAYEGVVRDEDGSPIPGAVVKARQYYRRGMEDAAWTDVFCLRPVVKQSPAITDADGRYRLTGVLPDARVILQVYKPGYTTHREWRGYDSNNVVMVRTPEKQRPGAITGRLVDERGRGVAGVLVSAAGRLETEFSEGRARTDSTGVYTIEPLLPTAHTVDAIRLPCDGVVRAIRDLAVPAGARVRAPDLVVSKGAPVYGRVTDRHSGKPVTGIKVRVYSSRGAVQDVAVDERGFYRARAIPGDVRVMYLEGSPAYLHTDPANYSKIDVPKSGKRFDIKLTRARTTAGKVIDDQGRPVGGAEVQLIGKSAIPVKAMTDSSGRFEIGVPTKDQFG